MLEPNTVSDSTTVLTNPVRSALAGPDAPFAVASGSVLGYRRDVAPFLGLPADGDPDDPRLWADLAALVQPGGLAVLADPPFLPPATWETVMRIPGFQMLAGTDTVAPERARGDIEFRTLGLADADDMIDLVARTEPGPFAARTVELGGYLGVREGGRLLAMAGERMHLPGWTEISAVCTDPAARGRGLAGRLVRAVAAGVRARGEQPFLHVTAVNPAVRLYESLGFETHREIVFHAVRPPSA